jgi:hypothetical protein
MTIILFLGCNRHSYIYIPPKGWEVGCSSPLACIPIDSNDIETIRKRALKGVFRIIDIKKQKGVYIIEVDSDSLFKDNIYYSYQVFSIEMERIEGHKKIKKKRKYELTLNPYFMHDVFMDFIPRRVYIKGKSIGVSTGRMNIYTTPNLNGLYYIEDKENK